MGVQVDIDPVNDPSEFETILSRLGAAGGAIISADAFLNNNHQRIVELAAQYRVPAIYGGGNASAKLGGLVTYNLDVLAQFRPRPISIASCAARNQPNFPFSSRHGFNTSST